MERRLYRARVTVRLGTETTVSEPESSNDRKEDVKNANSTLTPFTESIIQFITGDSEHSVTESGGYCCPLYSLTLPVGMICGAKGPAGNSGLNENSHPIGGCN